MRKAGEPIEGGEEQPKTQDEPAKVRERTGGLTSHEEIVLFGLPGIDHQTPFGD